MIYILDYGVGNIQAFLNLFRRLGIEAKRAAKPIDLIDATRLVLPGVGHFDHAMQQFNNSGLRPKLEELVFEEYVPIIGVCVGMQMLATGSDEGNLPGLNWIPGRVLALEDQSQCVDLPMPHMGWNILETSLDSKLFSKGFDGGANFYFLHSFFFEPDHKNNISATVHYGVNAAAAITKNNIHGVQFHPEKSHHWGEQLLKNFVEL